MEVGAGEVVVFHVAHGTGRPVLVLHGAGVDHREAEACFEPALDGVAGLRRVYPDLPGMGRTAWTPWSTSPTRSPAGRHTCSSATRRAGTTPRRWPRVARRRSPVWRSSAHCSPAC